MPKMPAREIAAFERTTVRSKRPTIHHAGKKRSNGEQRCARCGLVMASDGLMPWAEGAFVELVDGGMRAWSVTNEQPNCGVT